MSSNSMMGSVPIMYPWPDPTNKRIKRLEAERDSLLRLKVEREAEIVRLEAEIKRLRDGYLANACRFKCLVCGESTLLRRVSIPSDFPLCGTYCDAVIKEVDND